MLRRETNEGWQSTGIVERAVGVLTTSEVGDDRAGQRHEPADAERDHAAHDTP